MKKKVRRVYSDPSILLLSYMDDSWPMEFYGALVSRGVDPDDALSVLADYVSGEGYLKAAMDNVNPFYDDRESEGSFYDSIAGAVISGTVKPKGFSDAITKKMIRSRFDASMRPVSPGTGIYGTFLGMAYEKDFSKWFDRYARSHGLSSNPDDREHYYDYRGFWANSSEQEREAAVNDYDSHLPDTYKKPGHPTFSDESLYHDIRYPQTTGGHWSRDGFFEPSQWQKANGYYVQDAYEREMRQRYAESGFNDNAVSRAGAKGAYQIMPITQQDFMQRGGGSNGDLYDPEYSRSIRNWYINQLSKDLGDDWSLDEAEDVRLAKQYAAYNWGAGNLKKHLSRARDAGIDTSSSTAWLAMNGIPQETKDYVDFIVYGRDAGNRTSASFNDAYHRWSKTM